jgi:hypothetical protein
MAGVADWLPRCGYRAFEPLLRSTLPLGAAGAG